MQTKERKENAADKLKIDVLFSISLFSNLLSLFLYTARHAIPPPPHIHRAGGMEEEEAAPVQEEEEGEGAAAAAAAAAVLYLIVGNTRSVSQRLLGVVGVSTRFAPRPPPQSHTENERTRLFCLLKSPFPFPFLACRLHWAWVDAAAPSSSSSSSPSSPPPAAAAADGHGRYLHWNTEHSTPADDEAGVDKVRAPGTGFFSFFSLSSVLGFFLSFPFLPFVASLCGVLH